MCVYSTYMYMYGCPFRSTLEIWRTHSTSLRTWPRPSFCTVGKAPETQMSWRECQLDCSRHVHTSLCFSKGTNSITLPPPPPPPTATLQASVKVYPLPEDGSKEPPPVFSKTINTNPVECIIRLYVIRVSVHAAWEYSIYMYM